MTMATAILTTLLFFPGAGGFALTKPFSVGRLVEIDHERSVHPYPRLFLASVSSEQQSPAPAVPAPVFNGKRVLPYKVVSSGLKGHKVAAVYAVLNSSYQRGSDGWDTIQHVGVSQDLAQTLQSHVDGKGVDRVAHVRALSFSFPQPNAMQEIAQQWRDLAHESGADLSDSQQWESDVLDYLYDDEEDDDDDEDWLEMTSQAMATVPSTIGTPPVDDVDQADGAVVSPFEKSNIEAVAALANDGGTLAFTTANVDKVLDEVRPYLISDGGNVAVARVDEVERNVYLTLEGACGSCPSSTVTMQMGIERVLKENFPDLNQVLQMEDDSVSKPTELTWEAVEEEINRLTPAILAMGGVCQMVSVDPIGVVELRFRGANKVRQGLELALLDVPFVKHVKFVMGDDD